MSTQYLHYYLIRKSSKNPTCKKHYIFLRILAGSARIETSLKVQVDPEFWCKNSQRCIGKSPQVKEVNNILNTLDVKINRLKNELLDTGTSISCVEFKNRVFGISSKVRYFLEIFKDHNNKMEALLNQGYAKGTLIRFNTTWRHVQEFLQWKYNMNDIDINRINHAFITDFEFYLKSVKKIGNNTSVKYIKNFGKIIRICMANGWLEKNPLINYKAKLKEVNRDFLTMDEVNLIGSKSFLSTRIELVRDIFVFSCFTGLAYVDVKRLTRNHISIGIDGGKWIFIEREKTKVRSAIPLLPRAQEILTKYENHPVVLNTNVALPILSNQKMNSYLKEIADVCGINKELTFHIARHTFATSVTLANGVPIESVSKMLGHSSIKMTQHYAKVLDKKIGEDMAVLRSRLNTKEQVQKTAVTA